MRAEYLFAQSQTSIMISVPLASRAADRILANLMVDPWYSRLDNKK
jgi:hypothetical protein